VPFSVSSIGGAVIAILFLMALKKTGVLEKISNE